MNYRIIRIRQDRAFSQSLRLRQEKQAVRTMLVQIDVEVLLAPQLVGELIGRELLEAPLAVDAAVDLLHI